MIYHNKNIITLVLLLSFMSIFFAFGLYHLGKFETTDEHFWKEDRIQKYYNGIHEGITKGEWKKTRINDKPGVSVALLSGIALPFITHPETHHDTVREQFLRTQYGDTAISAFHTANTERMNKGLRLPILLFSTVMIGIFFILFYSIMQNRILSLALIGLIATTPALVGISQIINPDAVLWSSMSASILSYMAYIRRERRIFIYGTIFFGGIALLSKYTASLFFLLFPLFFILFTFYEKKDSDKKNLQTWLKKHFIVYISIIVGMCIFFALLMPAVIQKPEHFLYGTFLSPALATSLPFLGVIILLWFIDAFLLQARIFFILIHHKFTIVTLFISRILLAVLLFSTGIITFINANLENPWLPLSHLKEVGRVSGELLFPQILFTNEFLHSFFILVAQTQNFFFSLSAPIVILLLLSLLSIILSPPRRFMPETLFTLLLFFLFFIGGIMADIFVNVRYGIIFYPFVYFLIALVLIEKDMFFKKRYALLNNKRLFLLILFCIIFLQIFSLWNARPFYLTHENKFLPQEKFVADAWGYGLYEAAQYLNAQDNPQDIVVWSDAGGDSLCQFFVGSCLRPQKINISKVVPDYIIFTRRRSIIRPLQLKDTQNVFPSIKKILNQTPVWELHMNNRPENFVRIIKIEKF